MQLIKTQVNVPEMFVFLDDVGDLRDSLILEGELSVDIGGSLHGGSEFAQIFLKKLIQAGIKDFLSPSEPDMLLDFKLRIFGLNWNFLFSFLCHLQFL